MMATESGRAPTGQALVSDEAPAGLHPSGFDPSRVRIDSCERQLPNVAERWKRQYYRDGQWGYLVRGSSEEMYGKLLKVKTIDDLTALGLRDWVTERCDFCNSEPECWLEIGDQPDYDARWLNICLPCAQHLAAIATEARRAGTVEQGPVHEGAGPQDIAQGTSP